MGSIVMRDLLDADAKVQIVGTSRKHKQALQKISRMSGCNGCITTGDMNIWTGRM